MGTTRLRSSEAAGHTSRWARPLVIAAWTVCAGILVQASLAGPASFGSPELFDVHGWMGSAVMMVTAVVLILTLLAREAWTVRVLALLLVVGTIAQIGLGYAGRRGGATAASALHVPLGVFLLGLSVAVAMLVSLRTNHRRHPSEPD